MSASRALLGGRLGGHGGVALPRRKLGAGRGFRGVTLSASQGPEEVVPEVVPEGFIPKVQPKPGNFAGRTLNRGSSRTGPGPVAASPSPLGGGGVGGGSKGVGVVVADAPSLGTDEVDGSAYLQDVLNLSMELDPAESGEVHESFEPLSRVGAPQTRKSKEAKVMAKTIKVLTPEEAVHDKHHWMVVTVPEQPIAGQEFTVYFNSNASDNLRGQPRVQLQFGFNNWELKPEDGTPDRLEMQPAGVTQEFGATFYMAKIQVPTNSYEVNFVFSDGEWRFENNGGNDFKFPVLGGITWDDWIDTAGERAAKAAAAMAAAEAARQAAAESARQEALLKDEVEGGKRRAEEMRAAYEGLRAGGAAVWDVMGDPSKPLWKTLGAAKAGTKVQLLYNRANGPFGNIPIPEHEVLVLRYGYNGWCGSKETTMKRYTPPAPKTKLKSKAAPAAGMEAEEEAMAEEVEVATPAAPSADQDWWVAELDVPFEAVAVNFVINYYEYYDNNGLQDYKLLVDLPQGLTMDSWITALSNKFFEEQHAARLEAEAVAKKKNEARIAKKKEAQALVKAVERRKVRHVLYTEPEVVTAGKEVTLYYNPRDTNLAGRQRIWLQIGWNRWNHPRKFSVEMEPPAPGEQHFKATFKAPKDAYKMDFVFSDVESGNGTYDSRGGFDYHLPVEGSPVREPSLYVVHVAVEMAPIAKVGGLGDVVTALGRAVQDQGHLVEVILPKFQFFNFSPILNGQLYYETEYDWGGTKIYVTTAIVEGLRVWFIEPKNGFFDTGSVYGRNDDEVRFDFFCKAALEFLLRTGRQPDILHCHDWSSAYVAKTYWEDYQPYGLWKPKVVFTIHNLNYGKKKLSEAAYYCQKFTTVSPTYAFETGGNPVISAHTHKFMGIRNGIDMDLWDPENNQWLPMPYSADNVVEGKAAARKALRERLGLTGWGDKFIVGVVSRLTGQKGVHLIKHAAFRAVERGGQFVLLGSAPDPKVQGEFNALAGSLNGDVARFCFKYDEPLSHLIYAACDMIVVPSMFEPCGLTQMIAMRYGAVPIVRHTGGLKDTVFDVDFDKARAAWDVYGSSDWQRDNLDATNGFAFEGIDQGALDYAMNRAIDAWYNDRAWFQGLQKRVMEQDWSWNRPALDYIELYHAAKKA